MPRAGLGTACQLGEGSSFPEAAPRAHPLPAPSCLPLPVPLGILCPVLGRLVGISSCLNAEIRNGSTAKAVFLLVSVSEEVTPHRFRCGDLLFSLIRLHVPCSRFLAPQSWLSDSQEESVTFRLCDAHSIFPDQDSLTPAE